MFLGLEGEVWGDIAVDVLLDTLKIVPFLLLAYLALEIIEKKAEEGSIRLVHGSGKWGPAIGALLGLVPQCGFSAATSNLYAAGVITRGTLLAVFLSTSDEMLPILLSEGAPLRFILSVLAVKCVAGFLGGFLVDLVARRKGYSRHKEIHELCEQEGCRCEDGVFLSALRHTAKIALFLLLTNLVLTSVVEMVGEETLAGFVMNKPVLGELLSSLVGLIPNCAASVIITKLYLHGGMSAGAMLAGLLTGSGVGLLVLFRVNHNLKENLTILALLLALGIGFGMLGGLVL